jgi:DNA topoisomerase VI subunit A
VTRQQRKDTSRDISRNTRNSREALAIACDQCGVMYGPVAVADGVKHDQYLSRKIVGEYGGEVTETIRVHWEMTNNREALLFRGA